MNVGTENILVVVQKVSFGAAIYISAVGAVCALLALIVASGLDLIEWY